MNYLYIDANIYLKFYLGNKLFKVLETLVDNRDSIVVTQQISDEVFRNSVSVNTAHLKNTLTQLQWSKPSLPYNNASTKTILQIDSVYQQFKTLKKDIEIDLASHLSLISIQDDDVTKKLIEIFQSALQPTPEEISKSKETKAFGKPAGKKSDPIGDELSWVQLLNKLQDNDTLIIVTNDRDYASIFNNKSFINSKLHTDLAAKNIEYYVFSEILEGIGKLKELQQGSKAAFETKDFPSEEEQIEIKKEEQKIIVETSYEPCKHSNIRIMPNGIFDDYTCMDCRAIIYRQYSDDID